jgi:hypothetical protein
MPSPAKCVTGRARSGAILLEALLLISTLILVALVSPGGTAAWLSWLDVLNWTSSMWLACNVTVVLILALVRFGPAFLLAFGGRSELKGGCDLPGPTRGDAKRRRDEIERIQESRRRRIW